MKENKAIKCRCGKEFIPLYRNGIRLSKLCTECLISKGKEKIKKERTKELRERKEKLKTHSQWLRDLQKIFNQYIRLRDKDKPCISCGASLIGKYDAGHYFTVGAYPNLRFNEDNVHGQCVHCNQHKHGNVTEYSLSLPLRIGIERFEQLLESRSKELKITIPEIQEKIKEYKQKIKELNTI